MNYIERYWRDATPADAIKEPPMVARFKHEESGKWKIERLGSLSPKGKIYHVKRR